LDAEWCAAQFLLFSKTWRYVSLICRWFCWIPKL